MKILLTLFLTGLILQGCNSPITRISSPSVGQPRVWTLKEGKLLSVIGFDPAEDRLNLDSSHVLKVMDSWGDEYFFRATTMENLNLYGQGNPTTSTWTGYDIRSGAKRSVVVDEFCQLTLHKF